MNSSPKAAPSATTSAKSQRSIKKLPESKVQAAIMKHLEVAGWVTVKLIQTNFNGCPDLLAIRCGRYVWIEVKSETGKVAALQEFRHEELRRNGAEVIVARSTEDIRHLTVKKH